MTSRERVINALEFKPCDMVATEMYDTAEVPFLYPKQMANSNIEGTLGRRTDCWGCIWEVYELGITGEVKDSPFKDGYDGLDSYVPPYDVLESADVSVINEFCRNTDKFTYLAWETSYNIFERMQHLRGTENLLMDLAFMDEEVYKLRDMVHKLYMRQAEILCETEVDALHIADDWGTQISLLISPKTFREFFKPCYKEYIDYCHSKGKKVFMHSDGHITAIIPDLIEIGLDGLNSQVFCMDMEENARLMDGKLCYWGEICRQQILPFGTNEDVVEAVKKVASHFLREGNTGVVGQAFAGNDIPSEKLKIVADTWRSLSK